MLNIKVTQGQTLYDIAIQYCGSQAAAIEIALLNGIDLTASLVNGSTLTMPAIIDKRVVSYYANNSLVPASLNSN